MAASTIELEVRALKAVRFIGKKTIVEKGKTATKFVKAFREGGDLEELTKMVGRISPEGDFAIWMGDYDKESNSFTEIAGVFAEENCPVPPGYDYKDIPEMLLGIALISGATRSLTSGAHNKLVKLLKSQGYEADYSFGFSMEYYSAEKYTAPRATGELYTFGYLLPCKKA